MDAPTTAELPGNKICTTLVVFLILGTIGISLVGETFKNIFSLEPSILSSLTFFESFSDPIINEIILIIVLLIVVPVVHVLCIKWYGFLLNAFGLSKC